MKKIAITGPSGCGKTTLLNLLAGILLPSSGTIEVDGIDVSALEREDRQDYRALKMGLVFQEFELLNYLSLSDNILLPYRISPVLEIDDAVRERADKLIDTVGLIGKQNRTPRHLSQGERQRIAVCRALITQPSVIFGDEPTGNLDPANRDHVLETMWNYSEQNGAAIVIVTHDHAILNRFDRSIDIRELIQ